MKLRSVEPWLAISSTITDRGRIFGDSKSVQSKKPVEMTGGLATALKAWRSETMYAAEADYIFPSCKLRGKKPRQGSMMAKAYIRPAAIRPGVLEMRDGSLIMREAWSHVSDSIICDTG
jgi:hypothetical protein